MIVLFALEILRIWFVMPFPGSQASSTIGIAHFLANNIWWMRICLLPVVGLQLWWLLKNKYYWRLAGIGFMLFAYLLVAYYFNFRLQAERLYQQLPNPKFEIQQNNVVSPGKLVLGVVINNQARAYPIEIIGYHHQLQDTLGGEPLWVTYCTLCRSGRVFNPDVNGQMRTFRLVGIDRYNSIYEDNITQSWWHQATGEAAAGKEKGTSLSEIPSTQTSLKRWLEMHPESTILQPDADFKKKYAGLAGYDSGEIANSREAKEVNPFEANSWVITATLENESVAFNWQQMLKERVVNGKIAQYPLVVTLEADDVTFYVFKVTEATGEFKFLPESAQMVDTKTGSIWNLGGDCISGELKGSQLQPIQAYQQFYHTYKSFMEAK